MGQRLRRLCGYAGIRVGEASHPGPPQMLYSPESPARDTPLTPGVQRQRSPSFGLDSARSGSDPPAFALENTPGLPPPAREVQEKPVMLDLTGTPMPTQLPIELGPPEPAAAERPSASATSSNSYIQSSCSHREIAPHVHTTPHHITFHSTTRAKPNCQLIRSKQTKSRARVGVEYCEMHNNCPKTAETSAIRVSYKIAKTVSRHAEVQISGRFGSSPAVFIPQRRETGRPIPIQMQKLVNYYAIRSTSMHSQRSRLESHANVLRWQATRTGGG